MRLSMWKISFTACAKTRRSPTRFQHWKLCTKDHVKFATHSVCNYNHRSAAFTPVFFLEGIQGRIFRPLALSYITAIGSSLLVAITLIPVLCYYLMGRPNTQLSFDLSPFSKRLLYWYRVFLLRWLERPLPVMSAFLVLLLLAALLIPRLGPFVYSDVS